ncbi:MAG: hypothetical protein ACRCSG_05770 [Cellulosilyticaceae bacterium]
MKIIKMIAISILAIGIVGCGKTEDVEIDQLNLKLEMIQEQNRVLEERVEMLTNEVSLLIDENTQLIEEFDSVTKKTLPIYTQDIETGDIVVVKEIKVEKTSSLIEKLQILADELSAQVFQNEPIIVKEIKKINGEQVAIIDLQDKDKETSMWMSRYFQGTTGGTSTTTAIEETFLQKKYIEPWIDGIQVLYKGEELALEHITLGNIIYR